jgi:hypothetical protein
MADGSALLNLRLHRRPDLRSPGCRSRFTALWAESDALLRFHRGRCLKGFVRMPPLPLRERQRAMSNQTSVRRPCRVRVERGIYLQPNRRYSVCVVADGKPRWRTVATTLDEAREARERLRAAAGRGEFTAFPRVTLTLGRRVLAETRQESRCCARQTFQRFAVMGLTRFRGRARLGQCFNVSRREGSQIGLRRARVGRCRPMIQRSAGMGPDRDFVTMPGRVSPIGRSRRNDVR